MKFIGLVLLYILYFMLYYFILSSIGLLFGISYKEILANSHWFITYAIALGWWLAGLSCIEYADKYLSDIFQSHLN